MTTTTSAADRNSIIHWSLYGRRGIPSTARATPDSWQHKPIQEPATMSWDHVIPRGELPKLLNGVTPRQMEDKWFVYADGPDAHGNATLHIHRSWTGYKMVEAKLVMEVNENGEVVDTDARFTELTWETNRERYNGNMDAPDTVLNVAEWCMGCQIRQKPSAQP